MTQAFLILAHENVENLIALVRELPTGSAYIHLDRPFLDKLEAAEYRTLRSMATIVESFCLHWGGYSIHLAMMRLLEAAEESNSRHTNFTFLSGTCFPIRPVCQFDQYLFGAGYAAHCRAFELPSGTGQMSTERVTQRHYLDGAIGHLRKRHQAIGGALRRAVSIVDFREVANTRHMRFYAGSQWITLSRPVATDLLMRHYSGEFDLFRNSFAPDEMVIQTAIHTSKWSTQTAFGGPEPRPSGGGTMSPLTNHHWIRPSMQGTISLEDVDEAMSSGQFFIRKVPNGSAGRRMREYIRESW